MQDTDNQMLFLYKTLIESYMADRIAAILMTFNDFQSHLPIANLFKCDCLYSCGAIDNDFS